MNIFKSSILAVTLTLLFASLSFADTIPGPGGGPSILTVNVTDTCSPIAVDNNTQTYTGQFLAICALLAAKNQGVISAYELNYHPVFGFYLASLNGITPTGNQFWYILINDTEANGLSIQPVATNDILKFQLLSEWMGSVLDTVQFKINTTITAPPAAVTTTAGGGGVWMHPPFDVSAAFAYLATVQNADGSFGSSMLSDWVSIAASEGESGTLKAQLASYQASHPLTSTMVTENERHAMALEALGIDPYVGTSVDYITPIVNAFDGTQIGDPSLVNDDVFAIFPLLHAGYTVHDPIITATAAFIIAKQDADGSWAGSVDMTAAAIQALSLMPDSGEMRFALSKATGYLRSKQLKDGSFGNVSSSSWMLQAIAAMHGTASDWQQQHATPDYYLATVQEKDGGVMASTTQDRIWATAYAIPGITRATWDSLLKDFSKPASVPVSAVATSTPTSDAAISAPESGPVMQIARAEARQAEEPQPEVAPQQPEESTSSQVASAASAAGPLNENLWFFLIAFLILLGYCTLAYRSIRKRR